MTATVHRWVGRSPSPSGLEQRLRDEGLAPHGWSNGPGETYGWHAHGYHKVLYCVSGGITFHLRDQDDVELGPGDRLEVEPGTDHAATVGPHGVRCVEAGRA
ncbi:MAG TPA: cupin domain-containing protein [Acidimicrobiales bacterium]|nr:cupin domain-containing protein [Acidimicrobiales bacterium]